MKTKSTTMILPFLMMGLLVMLTNSCDIINDPDPVLEDVDGNIYETVTIGDQVWMAENLKTTRFSDGTAIPLVSLDSKWESLTTPGYCWYDNDKIANGETYGALYNWYAVDTEKLCPSGWHVPSDEEWTTLTTYLGGDSIAAADLKESGTMHWETPNTGANNVTNFTALPGGYRDTVGVYFGIENYGFWWTASSISGVSAHNRSMSYASQAVISPHAFKRFGFAIRCIKDE